MTIPPQYEQILDLLATKTNDGKVNWTIAPDDSVCVSLRNYSISLMAAHDEQDDSDFVRLSLYDRNGKLIDSFWCEPTDAPHYDRLVSIQKNAKRKALGIDVALSEIESALRSEDGVGFKPTEAQAPSKGEDIPF